MIHYIKTKTFLPWKQNIVYCDVNPYKMDHIMENKKLLVKFSKHEMVHPSQDFVIVFATINKRDVQKFEICLREFEKCLLLTGDPKVLDNMSNYFKRMKELDCDIETVTT